VRLAFVTGTLNFGGGTSLLALLSEGLAGLGVTAEVFSYVEPPNQQAVRFTVPLHTPGRQGLIYEDAIARIVDSLERFNPSVVVAWLGPGAFEAIRYAPQGVARIGVAVSDDDNVYSTMARYAKCVDLVCGNALQIRERLSTVPAFSTVPIDSFVTGVCPPLDTGLVAPHERPLRIVTLSRLVREQKRVQFLPEILSVLEKSGRPMIWKVIGEGADKAWLESEMQARAANISVEFTGGIPFEQVDAALSGSDLFLLTSDYEGLPLALVHSMMNRLVPVVSDLPSGIPELVDETTGILVDPSLPGGYAAAILALDADRERLARLANAARERAVRTHSVDVMARDWLRLLERLPSAGSGGRWDNKIRRPLGTGDSLRFHPLVRWPRRLAARIFGGRDS